VTEYLYLLATRGFREAAEYLIEKGAPVEEALIKAAKG